MVRASGHSAIDHEDRALEYFLAEGTPLVHTPGGYRIAMARARYQPWRE